MTSVPNIELNNGIEMPQLGLGVFQVPDGEAARPSRPPWTRVPQHRHCSHLRQRARGRPGYSRFRHPPRRAVRHHQALER